MGETIFGTQALKEGKYYKRT